MQGMKPNFLTSLISHAAWLQPHFVPPAAIPAPLPFLGMDTTGGVSVAGGGSVPCRVGTGLDVPGEGRVPGQSCCHVQATSQLKPWWGNGNFPPVPDAASDLKMPAQAGRMGAGAGANAI